MNLKACFDKEVVLIMWPERMESGRLKIVSVGALDGDSFGITLESGHTILLELGSRIREPAFAALVENGEFCKPRTDGERIYWLGGASITLEEILEMLLSPGDEVRNQNNHEEE